MNIWVNTSDYRRLCSDAASVSNKNPEFYLGGWPYQDEFSQLIYYFVDLIFFKVFGMGKYNNLSDQANGNNLYSKDDQ